VITAASQFPNASFLRHVDFTTKTVVSIGFQGTTSCANVTIARVENASGGAVVDIRLGYSGNQCLEVPRTVGITIAFPKMSLVAFNESIGA
jgi:hypothetical protein